VNCFAFDAATSIVCRAELGTGSTVAQHGMSLIGKILQTQVEDVQSKTMLLANASTNMGISYTMSFLSYFLVASLLLNNTPFLRKVASFLSESTTPKVSKTNDVYVRVDMISRFRGPIGMC
jgi:hypothetical protein